MKKLLLNVLKWGVSLAIVGYLLVDAMRSDNFQQLAAGPKNWGQLAIAQLLVTSAVVVTIIRWYILVVALNVPFTLRDAFRLGFLGYLLNFVSLGAVGGDLFKAVFVAREQPVKRAEAVATIVFDRVIGLYSMFVVASVAIAVTGLSERTENATIRAACQGTFLVTALGATGIVLLLVPGFTSGTLSRAVERLPLVGNVAGRIITAIRIYRSKPLELSLTFLLSFAVHSLASAGIYFTAQGLLQEAPSLSTHLVVVPLAMVSGVLPLPLNGLGGFEYLLDFLYQHVPGDVAMTTAHSLLVALGYRIETIIIALVGACIYLTSRKEINAALHEAEEMEQAT